MASECLEELIAWLKAGGNVGIHGALMLRFRSFGSAELHQEAPLEAYGHW